MRVRVRLPVVGLALGAAVPAAGLAVSTREGGLRVPPGRPSPVTGSVAAAHPCPPMPAPPSVKATIPGPR